MKHIIMCSCGKLAIQCDEASKGLELIRNEGIKDLDTLQKTIFEMGKELMLQRQKYQELDKLVRQTIMPMVNEKCME